MLVSVPRGQGDLGVLAVLDAHDYRTGRPVGGAAYRRRYLSAEAGKGASGAEGVDVFGGAEWRGTAADE